jgi:hypothetical protein
MPTTGPFDVTLHGMRWRSDVDLRLPPTPGGPADVRLRVVGERPVGDDPPPGEVLAHLAASPDRPMFTFARDPDGVVTLRFHRLAELVVNARRDEVRCWTAPGVDPDYLGVLGAGMLATVLLVLAGHPVLHGSAVEVDGRALALVGASGMGKSTLSTLLVQDGAALITDDVLRLDPDGDGYVCRNGATEGRLRPTAALAAVAGRRTADGRTAVAAARVAADRVPLAVVAVPFPTRDTDRVQVEWLEPRAALFELLRFPRIVGWTDPVTTAEHFSFVARVVGSVPVARVRVPWGTPPPPSLAGSLRAALLTAPPSREATSAP